MSPAGSHRRRPIWLLLVATITLWGCVESAPGTDGPVGPPTSDAPTLALMTASGLQVAITDEVPASIRVRATDASGRPIRSAWVTYEVVVGEGVFSADSTLTNDQGVTEVLFRPLSLGTVVVRARITLPSGTSDEMVTFQVLSDPDLATGFARAGGDDQTGAIGTVLSRPFVVRVTNPDGFPVDSFPVTFALSSPDSIAMLLDPATGDEAFQVTVLTDAEGFARAFLRLGSRPGVYSVTASALVGQPGAETLMTMTFAATATLPAGSATRLLAIAGDRQTVTIGKRDTIDPTVILPLENPEAPNPLVVQAVDRFGNPVSGVQVFWNVSDGGGVMFTFSTFTDQNGITINVVTGVTFGRNIVEAVAATTNRVSFIIEAVSLEDEDQRPGDSDPGPPKEGSGGTPVN